jgi:hypothetical protein
LPDPANLEQSEDLFFYKQPKVSLKRGDRALFSLFSTQAPFEHLYTLDLLDLIVNAESYYRPAQVEPEQHDVWHTIQLKNTAGLPLTTAPVTVVKDQQIMGQDTLNYTSAGAEINVKMSKALDIRAKVYDEELARERAALRFGSTTYDKLTIKSQVVLTSRKGQAVKLRVRRSFSGELVSATKTPKHTKSAKGVRQVNTTNLLEWTIDLPSGKEATLDYSYTVLVRT